MKVKKLIAIALSGLMTAAALSSCMVIDRVLGDDSQTQTFESTGQNGTYSVTAPKNWSALKGELIEGAELELGNKVKEQYLVVLRESKEDLEMTFEEYQQAVQENTESSLENAQVGAKTGETINGEKAVCMPISGTVDKLNVQYWLHLVDHEDAYIRIITWTLKSKAEESKQIMQDAAVSLTIQAKKSEI